MRYLNEVIVALLLVICAVSTALWATVHAYAEAAPQAAAAPAKDPIQAAAKDGQAATVQQAVEKGADKLTPEDSLSVLDNLRQRAKFEGTLADHILIQKAVDTLKSALQELINTKAELEKAQKKIEELQKLVVTEKSANDQVIKK